MRRHVLTALGLLITVVCLWWAFRGLDFGEIVHTLSDVNVWWVVPIFGATILSLWFRGVRWKVMLEPIHPVTSWQAYDSTMIGFMANNILPMRLGEVVRAYALGHHTKISKSTALATVLVERAFDLAILLFVMAGLLLYFSFDSTFRVLGYTALAACVLMFVFMGLAHHRRDLAMRILERMVRPFPETVRHKAMEVSGRFLIGFQVLGHWKHVVKILFWSVMVWVFVALGFHFTFMAFDMSLPNSASLVLMVVCALGIMIPSSPGFIGTFEVAAKFGLMLFKSADRMPLVTEEVAASYAVFYHAVQFVPLTLLGLLHLWRSKLSISQAMDLDSES